MFERIRKILIGINVLETCIEGLQLTATDLAELIT